TDSPNGNQRPLRRIADREDAYFRIVPLLESSSIYGMKTNTPAERDSRPGKTKRNPCAET
ncbi:MAG: hypothetical protein AAAB35_21955, partial [Phyllobacterium sp.]|uniref:hypothetical protein n=1 Tax=Phyllobacterium sp. TaxID=1871046 RepID=UPI0030F159E0